MTENPVCQTSHIEFTAPQGSLMENRFCILCGLIGIAMFIAGWIYVTFFPAG
ncbi:MAG: hypothetical protein ACFFE2_04970 [Candidatus Thorarchaeota archaeon]